VSWRTARQKPTEVEQLVRARTSNAPWRAGEDARLKECVSLHTDEEGVIDWRTVTNDFNDDTETRTLSALKIRWGELKSGEPKRKRKRGDGSKKNTLLEARDVFIVALRAIVDYATYTNDEQRIFDNIFPRDLGGSSCTDDERDLILYMVADSHAALGEESDSKQFEAEHYEIAARGISKPFLDQQQDEINFGQGLKMKTTYRVCQLCCEEKELEQFSTCYEKGDEVFYHVVAQCKAAHNKLPDWFEKRKNKGDDGTSTKTARVTIKRVHRIETSEHAAVTDASFVTVKGDDATIKLGCGAVFDGIIKSRNDDGTYVVSYERGKIVAYDVEYDKNEPVVTVEAGRGWLQCKHSTPERRDHVCSRCASSGCPWPEECSRMLVDEPRSPELVGLTC
jgi:hypothetical protein